MSKRSKQTKQQPEQPTEAATPQQQPERPKFQPFVYREKHEQTRIPVITKAGTESANICKGADIGHYVVGMAKTPSGKRTLDIGDEVACWLRGRDRDSLIRFTEDKLDELGFDHPDLASKYERLNDGQVRMNCGNRLRNALKQIASE